MNVTFGEYKSNYMQQLQLNIAIISSGQFFHPKRPCVPTKFNFDFYCLFDCNAVCITAYSTVYMLYGSISDRARLNGYCLCTMHAQHSPYLAAKCQTRI